MANVTFDDASRTDPRFVVLGKLLGTSKYDARGRMLEVYSYCTDLGTYSVRSEMLDALVERDGFGPILVAAELAEECEDGSFRIRGTKGRIEWLARLRKNSRKGGAANRARLKPEGSLQATQKASQLASQNEAKAEPSYSYSYSGSYSGSSSEKEHVGLPPQGLLSIVEPKAESEPKERPLPGTAATRKEAADWVEWFNRKFGRQYKPEARELVDLVTALIKAGYTQEDMRAVAWHRRSIWGEDPKMSAYLVPSTLLRFNNFKNYVAEAQEWLAQKRGGGHAA